ncbi:acyl-CoA thioesterase [Suttonella sp. R2A3]|uniref:acyl-CoA thioesterase n=1 Tax=Suttonella sp. R2A3 TaxID=2908648 RepID=UPI001F451435|nr:acyl-CoA thioesterase [Suttonella sp. R2A3]UJF25208.1 acyl-CoA thioesterase [Suttonella sp. R2A3]
MHEFKCPNDSEILMALLMQPEYANFGGNIHGGYLLSLMDQAAYACASKHAQAYCVTASVNTVNFRTPIHVGDLISIKARVNYTGATSMVIGLRVEAENLIQGTVRHSNSSYFTMVAKDNDGHPQRVPGLILRNNEDVRRFVRSHERREERRSSEQRFNDRQFSVNDDILDWLNRQNAQLKLD